MTHQLDQEKSKVSADEKPINFRFYVIIAALGILGFWFLTFVSFIYWKAPDWLPIGDRGTFGDMFGGLNALFSGAAFAGIIITILLQRRELELQRKELKLTRDTLNDQKNEMSNQTRTMAVQRFENTFFSLLSAYNSLVQSYDLYGKNNTGSRQVVSVGRDCFGTYFNSFSYALVEVVAWEEFSYEDFSDRFDSWYLKTYRADLSHYFTVIENILLYVEEAEMLDRQKYANFLSSFLSDHEQIMLFYFSITRRGSSLRPLLINYSVLRGLPEDLLLHDGHVKLLNELYEYAS